MLPMSPTFEILYHDDHLVAINKPTNWFVHRSEFDRREEKIILQHLRNQISAYLYPVHRLDRPTSGVLVFALSLEAARQLSDQFQNDQTIKIYHAIVRGYPNLEGTIDRPLQREHDKMPTDREGNILTNEPDALKAITHYRRLDKIELPIAVSPYPSARYSLMELNPITGRMHQIRRHLKHIAHPIVGDTTHGDLRHNRSFQNHFKLNRLWLHATHLQLLHPMTGKPLSLSAPWDNQWRQLMRQLQWNPQLDEHKLSHYLRDD